jgi:hypothetical protein
VGGQVDARMFIADAMEVTQTLPFKCDSLQRSRYGWLCETAYVRDLITVRTFIDASVSIVDQRRNCSSACVVYPGVRRDLLFWPEGSMTKVVLLP